MRLKLRRGRPKKYELIVTEEHRSELKRLAALQANSSRTVAFRARIVLSCDRGLSDIAVAKRLHTTSATVRCWRNRFIAKGIAGLGDAPRPGRPREVTAKKIGRVLRLTLEKKPKEDTHWSGNLMAAVTGLSQSTINRIWRIYGLKPHLGESVALSSEALLADRVREITGLYMNPPHHVLVLCVDKKDKTQVLNYKKLMPHMQPEGWPHKRAQPESISPFAVLDIATGQILGKCHRLHRSAEFLDFLKRVDAAVSANLDLHLILDNPSTHKAASVQQWLQKRPRYHLHFTPTHASWLSYVERWFALFAQMPGKRRLRRSVSKLKAAVREVLVAHNQQPTPFWWTKSGD